MTSTRGDEVSSVQETQSRAQVITGRISKGLAKRRAVEQPLAEDLDTRIGIIVIYVGVVVRNKTAHRDIVPGGLFQMGDVSVVLWSDYYDAEKGGIARISDPLKF